MDYRNPQNPSFPQKAAESCGCPDQECTKTGVQYANISTPIDITPDVKIGKIETEYLGDPEVCCLESHCKKPYKLMVSQKIRIKVPIHYQIIACAGESSITCDCDDSCCQ